jgi:hypothetical protein
MNFRQIDESPKTFILVFKTGDETRGGLAPTPILTYFCSTNAFISSPIWSRSAFPFLRKELA